MNEGVGESKLERPLKPGEALVFSEENYGGEQQQITAATSIVVPDFPVASIRLGPQTGVTLYTEADGTGLSQDLTTELASFSESRLQGQKPKSQLQKPKSLNLWSTADRPFSGYWAIEVVPQPQPADQGAARYLSVGAGGVLTTSKTVSDFETFKISEIEGKPGTYAFTVRGVIPVSETPTEAPQSLTIDDLHKVALSVEPAKGFRMFSLLAADDRYICYNPGEQTFYPGTKLEDRAIFCESIKIAENESQVGELIQGEVALYENPAYWGKAWVFYTDYAYFTDIAGLNDVVSSIQIGPMTGVTIYLDVDFNKDSPKSPKQDVTSSMPSLKNEQVGEDAISSMDLWRIVPPEGTGVTFTCKLSQDFSTAGNNFKEFSAYRTTLQFPSAVQMVELETTDATDIEVDGNPYHVEEDQSISLKPNLMQRLVITSDSAGAPIADGPKGCLRTPGLKIRTNTMGPDERMVIHPDQHVHERLASLKQDEMFNASYKDDSGAQCSIIKERSAQKQKDVASAQSMIGKVMSTVKYQSGALGGVDQSISAEGLGGKSWALDFSTYRVTVRTLFVRQGPDTSYDKIGYLKRNEVVQVLGFNVDGDWVHIKRLSDGLTGWSFGAFLGIIHETRTSEQYRVKAAMLQVREGPGTIHRQVGLLYKGDLVTAAGVNETGTWRKIVRKKDGLTGWSFAEWLEPVEPDQAAESFALPEASEPEQMLTPTLSGLSPIAQFHEISQEEVQALLARAEFPDANLAQNFWDFCKDIYNDVKKAVTVVITTIANGVQILIDLGKSVIDWVVDTAEKAIACVEAIIEKIGAVIEEIVKWLRMIFEWKDILHTRDTLRDSINNSLDYMEKKLVDVKEPVHKFFKEQKTTLTDGLNHAIEALGGDSTTSSSSSKAPSGPSEVLEAVDWVLSKVMGGIMPAFGTSSLFAASSTAEGDKKLQDFWQGTLADGVRVVSALPEALANILSSLLKHPTEPLLVIADVLLSVRNLLNNLFDLGEDLVLGLFDLGSYLIKNIKAVFSAKIRIPFISDLLEWVGRLLGKNWNVTLGFSILDAATLILAIPVTILSKIRLGRAPFSNVPALAMGVDEWTLTAGLAGFMGGLVSIPLDMTPETEAGLGTFGSIMEVCSLVFVFTNMVASWGPDLVSINQTGKDKDGNQRGFAWGMVLGFEAGLFLLDIISLIYSAKKSNTAERLKRFERDTIIFASAMGCVHFILCFVKDWGQLDDLALDTVAILPEIGSFIRLFKNPYIPLAFWIIDSAAAETSLVMGLVEA